MGGWGKKNQGPVLVTGASTGIGRACALLLARSGHRVFAGVRRETDGHRLQELSGGRIEPVLLDITDSQQISEARTKVAQDLEIKGGLAGLVNNAGMVVAGPLEFLPVEELRKQFEVNVIGHVAVTQAFFPLIRQAGGRIVNIGSTAAFFAAPFLGGYAGSKFAVSAVSDAMRREFGLRGVWVSLVQPGYTETPVWDKGYDQAEKLLDALPEEARETYVDAFCAGKAFLDRGRHTAIPPEAVARRVRHALVSRWPRRQYLVGTDTYVLALAQKFLPAVVADRLVRRFTSA